MAKKKRENNESKEFIVLHRNMDDYEIFDLRSNRPICYKENKLDPNAGSMVLQEIDTFEFSSQPKRNPNTFEFFAPNNIALMLSIMQKSIDRAKEIYLNHLNPDKFNHSLEYEKASKKEKLYSNSINLYDYIEQIQSSIVFGYTALEAFTNLSIPNGYVYTSEKNSKGIQEVLDKEAIERWLSLKVKISNVLQEVYETDGLTKLPIWSKFLKFEEMRHDIIHQKSIQETDFYKLYLKKNIFEICSTPIAIIQYFYDSFEKKNSTNPIWPWIINRHM
ncbi:hypothetical protein K7T73_03480 [Bacillus badius]|uniref:hypothetical protein n=1 Tax=Bacillus badius TaxID=1455 RepID=UPI001CBC0055|nr:hypothetical protein [Bacillus badius]UAT31309.1 hypothetical protein K7T73_03480 [Bacillus badius]